MALIPCRECQKPVSTEAAACPHCGASTKKKGRSGGCAVLILALLIVAAIVLGTATDHAPPPAPEPQASKAPQVRVAHDATTLEITNLGSNDWREATIYINGTPPDAYKITVAAPRPGQSKRVSLADFTKRDGQRFNPFTHKLTVIWIGGSGYDFASYNAHD